MTLSRANLSLDKPVIRWMSDWVSQNGKRRQMAKSQKFMLAQPEEIILSSSIENPDKHLDALIRGAKGNENLKSRLSAIKLLDNKTKAKWLLDLSDTPGATDRGPSVKALPAVPPLVVCTLVTVTSS